MRKLSAAVLGLFLGGLVAGPALACGGLVAPNGSVNLLRTSTLAAYKDGVEHYVTSFEFTGKGGAKFGSIVPLPGVPTNVRKGGAWTLQRLQQETQPPVLGFEALSDEAAAASPIRSAKVILEKDIAALDVTVLEGGAQAVGEWAESNDFFLPPDSPEVLEFYAARSPIFMAVEYDVKEAKERGLTSGDGTPVHVSVPTPNPWVPLRILGLGKSRSEVIEADVYLLTEDEPAMLPAPGPGMKLEYSEEASPLLLSDLRSDRGMKWLPRDDMWLSYLKINTTAGNLTNDLAIDASGAGQPSPRAAGLTDLTPAHVPGGVQWWPWALAAGLVVVVLMANEKIVARRP
jgi:Uncharacterized protein conserved in bacteria (DUF2330)